MTLRGPPSERSPAELLSFGVVNLDKPPGPSAHQVADWVRECTAESMAAMSEADSPPPIDRAAHAGTLDPKVTGSLPMLLGEATRVAQVFDDSVKEYVAVLELHGPPPVDLGAIVSEFEGRLYQKPPRKSAVSRRLRVREVHQLDILEQDGRQVLLRVRCEAGTYIRKLCHDIGLALGVGAHMGDLRRSATGRFDDSSLVTMEDFVDALAFWEDGDSDPLVSSVLPAEAVLSTLPRVYIAPNAAHEVAEGAPVYAPGVIGVEPALEGSREPERGSLVACFTPNEAAVCLGLLAGDPDATSGLIVDLERVLV